MFSVEKTQNICVHIEKSSTKFTKAPVSLTRYMKGTVEHGTILGAVEEIVLTLDDNSMNLQSMSASRYVGPFLEKVQKWEKSLSHISEVVEVCKTCNGTE